MGFRWDYGATFACRLHNGYLETEGPDIHRYKTTLNVEIDYQCNMFRGVDVLFLLLGDNRVYVGLKDGNIVVTDTKGLLIAIHTWEVPRCESSEEVGYYRDKGSMYPIVMREDEPHLLHTDGGRETFVLNDGLAVLKNWDAYDESSGLREIFTDNKSISVKLEGGEYIDVQKHGQWRTDERFSEEQILQF